MKNIELKKLSEFLINCQKDTITLSLNEIETIICSKLPSEALNQKWWWNISSSTKANCWLSAGYKTVDAKYVSFRNNITFVKIENKDNDADLNKENSLIKRIIYFLSNEDNPSRKKFKSLLAIPFTLLTLIGLIYGIIADYKSINVVIENINTEYENTYNYLYDVGKKYYEDQNYKEAFNYFELSLDKYNELTTKNTDDMLKILSALGDTCLKLTYFEKGIENYIKAISIIEKLDLNKKEYISLFTKTAYLYLKLSDFYNAEKYLVEAKNLYSQDEISSFTTSILFIYMEYYINKSIDESQRIVLSFDSNNKDNQLCYNIDELANYLNIIEIEATINMYQQNYEDALFLYEQVLAFWDYLLVYGIYDNSLKIGSLYDSLSICSIYLGNLDDGIKYNKLATDIFNELLGSRNIDTGISYLNMGAAYMEIKDYENAYKFSLKCIAILETSLGNNNYNIATAYNNIAICLDEKGETIEAEKYFQKCIEIYNNLGIETINTFRTYISYSLCLADLNKLEKAKEFIDKAYFIAPLVVNEDTSDYKQFIEAKECIYYLIDKRID